ncbi:MAG TPA: hypothetical protein VHD69_02310 [Candidatus Paceibacterota bacterium]|jgi:hypothetical protein|nr:hypothetical protein [Candidatus Paceibacterota bacterium]
MKTGKKILTSHLAKRIALCLLAVLSCSISLHAYLAYEEASRSMRAASVDAAGDRLDSLSRSLETFAIDARNDIKWMSDIIGAHEAAGGISDARFKTTITDFADKHREYCHIYYEPIKGKTFSIVTQEYSEASGSIAAFIDQEPQFKALLEYLRVSGNKDVQLSGLMEYTFPNGIKTPFVHLMAPVSVDGEVRGYIALTLDLKYVLDEIRGAERVNELVFLADHDGKLMAARSGKEFSSHLSDMYPIEVVADLFGSDPAGSFLENGKVFTYRHIELPGVRQGVEEDNFWVLASVSAGSDIFHWQPRLILLYSLALATSLMLIGAIGIMVARIKHED